MHFADVESKCLFYSYINRYINIKRLHLIPVHFEIGMKPRWQQRWKADAAYIACNTYVRAYMCIAMKLGVSSPRLICQRVLKS